MDEYLSEVQAILDRDPSQREGQAFYNAFRIRWPELEAEVVGTEWDPFNDDRRLPAFLGWLEGRV